MSRRGYGGGSSYRGSGGSRGGGGWSDSRPSRGGSRGMGNYPSRGGGYSSSRGSDRSVGGRYWSSDRPPSPFDSRSRYPPSSDSRYPSRHDEPSFKRPYRPDTSYSSRDMSGHRSPERKRIRSEVQGDRSPRGLRRNQESSYSDFGSNGGHRYEPAPRYSNERRFSSDRRSSGGFRPPPSPPPARREEFRKPSARGGYRGRISTRGLSRREILRRRADPSFSRVRGSVRSGDLRKARLAKLRSAAARRVLSTRKFRSSRAAPRREAREKKEKWDAEVDDEKDDKSGDDKKEESDTEAPKSPKLNGTTSPTGEDADEIVEDKKEEEEDADEAAATDKDAKTEGEPRGRYSGRRFIRLTCVHCHKHCVTFNSYNSHLQSSKHLAAMRRVAVKQKSVLSRMRVLQRSKQRDLDKDDENVSSRKNFCLLCKLNYKQLKSVHQNSEAHKEMKRFLMPFCKTCHITFRSPMLYENHICSLEHIKRKAKADSDDKGQDGQSGGENEPNLDSFLTLDSIGDIDAEEGNESDKNSKDTDVEDVDDPEGGTPKAKKEIVNVGQEHIRKIEVLYCDLCRTYLTSAVHSASEEKRQSALKAHCRSRPHLKKYVKKTEDAALRETAERIHRNNQAKSDAKDIKKEPKKGEDENDHETDAESENVSKTESEIKIEEPQSDEIKDEPKAVKEEDGDVDKMWADVDKDLGDLLAEVEEPGNKSSDEDEEKVDSERFDRLNSKEKIDSVKKEKEEVEEKSEEGK